jgi:uncharacterized protein (DUF4415 family)
MTKNDQEEPDARMHLWPRDPVFIREAAAAMRAGPDGPKIRVTVELDARTAAILMLTGKGWIQRIRRAEAAAWGRPVEPWTDADVLPFEVGRVASFEATATARRWEDDPWIALMLAAGRGEAEPGE